MEHDNTFLFEEDQKPTALSANRKLQYDKRNYWKQLSPIVKMDY